MKIVGLTKISSKGQVTIPKDVREALELNLKDNLLFLQIDKPKIYIDKEIVQYDWEDIKWKKIQVVGITKITSQGQITLPKEIRDEKQFENGDTIIFIEEQNRRIYIDKDILKE